MSTPALICIQILHNSSVFWTGFPVLGAIFGDFWGKFETCISICAAHGRPLVAKFYCYVVQTLFFRVQKSVSRFRPQERFPDVSRKNRTFTMGSLSRARFYIIFLLFKQFRAILIPDLESVGRGDSEYGIKINFTALQRQWRRGNGRKRGHFCGDFGKLALWRRGVVESERDYFRWEAECPVYNILKLEADWFPLSRPFPAPFSDNFGQF